MSESKSGGKESRRKISRRTALKLTAGSVGAVALFHAMSPLKEFIDSMSLEEFVQKHYLELTSEDKQAVFARLEKEARDQYGAGVRITDPPPLPDTRFGYALNLSLCVGCRQCAEGCHNENNHDRKTNNSYIRVFEIEKGSLDLSRSQTGYTHPVPQDDKTYMPVACHHCNEPPCVDVCPVRATWKEPDGIVVVDYSWCIGCRYCEAACPYHARRFNWHAPEIPAGEVNPEQAYLSNRIRPAGAMEKCTFCLQRVRKGRLPACLEACPAGARVFGNLLDPESNIRWVLENKRVFVLKEDQGTVPSFFYFFSV